MVQEKKAVCGLVVLVLIVGSFLTIVTAAKDPFGNESNQPPRLANLSVINQSNQSNISENKMAHNITPRVKFRLNRSAERNFSRPEEKNAEPDVRARADQLFADELLPPVITTINASNASPFVFVNETFVINVTAIDDRGIQKIEMFIRDNIKKQESCLVNGEPILKCQRTFYFKESQSGNYSYLFLVTDIDNLTDSDTVDISVLTPPSNISEDECALKNRTGFRYDKNGNLIAGYCYLFEYDGFNQLKRIKSIRNITLAEFFYDHEGRRIKKIEYGGGQRIVTYYLGKNLVRAIDAEGGSSDTVYYYHNDELIGSKNGDHILYYHPDQLGSTSLITDQVGRLFDEIQYSPFGAVLGEGDSRYLYTGKEKDKTGLYYYESRFYDPQFYRFIQPDSIIPDRYNPKSLNKYAYAINNPYRYTDPSGNFFWDIFDVGLFSLDLKQFKENPTIVNALFLGVSTLSLAPILPNFVGYVRRGGEGVVKGAEFIRGESILSEEARILRTGEHGTTVYVGSFPEAEKLAHEAFPGYTKITGNSQLPKSEARFKALRDAYKKPGTYKMDYQYVAPDRIHNQGQHAYLPHINVHRLDKNEVYVIIDKAKQVRS